MYKVLTDKFHFDPKQIVTLSEKVGKDNKDYLPTKANIKREWARLAKVAKEGDYVVIHMGGHGSQQPEDRPAKEKLFGDPALVSEPEPDGLDEIFLPRDVGKWDGGTGLVKNAIIDDEIANWLQAIRDKKASVWVIFDSCHSGTMTRGGGDDSERTRELDMVNDLGIKQPAIDEAVAEAAKREKAKGERARGGPPLSPFKLAEKGGLVAIYAAQPTEVTLERKLPPMSSNSTVYGLLSYTIAQILIEASEKSSQPITYNELAKRIQAQYTAWGRSFPTPLIEGEDKDREVLGDKIWEGRSSMQLTITFNGYKVNAGAIHGLTPDSILSVTPPPGQGKDLLGYVKVKETRPFDADVEPCDQDGKAAKTEFPNAAICQKYFLAVGDQRLRVAIDPSDETGGRLSEGLERLLREKVGTTAKDAKMIQLVDKPAQADWLIRKWSRAKDKIILVPGDGLSVGRDNVTSDALGPAAVDQFLVPWLSATLQAISRAEAVKRVAASGGSEGSDQGAKVKVELLRYRSKSKEDLKNPIPVPAEGIEVPIYSDDLLALRITNPTRANLDVSVLYIDSRCGIDCRFPGPTRPVNRLFPNDSILVPDPSSKRPALEIDTSTLGREYFVVLAVAAQGSRSISACWSSRPWKARRATCPTPFSPRNFALRWANCSARP
jgi:hypothetical protein